MDGLENTRFYKLAQELWEEFWMDSEVLKNDERGKILLSQLMKSVDSIASNIEEGFGRGFGKEYPQFLRFARGSARESKGRTIASGMCCLLRLLKQESQSWIQ